VSHIDKTVTSSVYLGQNGISDTLVIGPTGRIVPTSYGAPGVVSDNGTIVGGTGANGYAPGNGGAGVYVNNATLINNGTITGGATGSTSGTYFHASPGYAVVIGADSTLVIDPGSVINGQVQAKGYNDTLALGGDTGASFSGLGTQFTGFAAVEVEKGANWTLKGADTLDDGASLTVDGRLGVSGSLTVPSPVTVDKGGLLRAGAGATVLMAGLTLNGGSIAEAGNGTLVVGASAAYAQPGALTVQAGYVVSGFGTVGGTAGNMVMDDGTITASGGTLNVALAVTGIGTLALDSGGTVLAHGAVSVADIVFNSSGNETLQFLSTASPTGTVTGFAAGDTIILGLRAKTFNFANDTLSLLGKGGIVLETLTFGSGYSAGDFVLSKVGHVSEITFAPPAHAEAGGLTHIDPLSDTMMHWGMAHNPMA
jgi:hypothetical protein